MAMVDATIANGGTMMEPRLVREVRSPDGAIIDKPTPRVRNNVMDKQTASTLGDMMQHVVTDVEVSGQIPGVKVAGKTGSAQASGDVIHSWYVSFAPADDPQIAVAVIVENGQEGYKAALPIATRLMETYLKNSGELPETPPSIEPAALPNKESTNESTGAAKPQNESTSQQNPFRLPFQNPFQSPGQSPGQKPPGG
jgi:peptidoglycan glycosyltransferase